MKSLFFLSFYLLVSFNLLAQHSIIEPGDSGLNSKLMNVGKFTWATKSVDEEVWFFVHDDGKEVTLQKRELKGGYEESQHTIVLKTQTLEPISENYKGEEVSYNLQFGSRIKGSRTIFETNQKESLDQEFTGKFFARETLPFVVSSLPLSLTYRAIIPVVNVTSSFKPEYLRYRIAEISEGQTFSCLSGKRDFWKVVLEEKKYSLELTIYIDKGTRRILRTEYNYIANLSSTIFADKESDVNPIKAKFNMEEAKAMLTGGTSVIKGQASTTDGAPKSVSKRSKLIYAPKGSLITIIPNTPYFKEWVEFNLYIGRISPPVYMDGDDFGRSERTLVQGCAYPLPPEVKQQTLTTDVVDDKGSFTFQNLKAGEYMIFVNFVADKYSRTTRTPNGSYSVIINPDGSGSAMQNVDVTHWATPKNVVNYQFVKIKKDGEAVNVDLK